jgi:hypothetical protein
MLLSSSSLFSLVEVDIHDLSYTTLSGISMHTLLRDLCKACSCPSTCRIYFRLSKKLHTFSLPSLFTFANFRYFPRCSPSTGFPFWPYICLYQHKNLKSSNNLRPFVVINKYLHTRIFGHIHLGQAHPLDSSCFSCISLLKDELKEYHSWCL